MKTRLIEESVLFVSILKWVVLATGVGVVVGLSTTAFLKILDFAINRIHTFNNYYFLLPLGLFCSALTVKYLAKDAKGYGTEKVIEAVHKQSGRIAAAVVPAKLIATVVTAAAGGSVGQVGPCAQIGGAITSVLSSFLKFDGADHKKLVICGISAGFASVMGAPIAGAIFGVEVLFVGGILYEVLLPSFIAGITSYHISTYFGINYFRYPINFSMPFSEAFFLKVVLAGIFFGVCAAITIEIIKGIDKLSAKVKIWSPAKGLIGGALLIGLALITSTQYLGLGMETIKYSLSGEKVIVYAFLLKAVFTGITFSFGGSGGMVTPVLFIGATAGSAFGDLLGLDRSMFSAIGMVAVLSGATNSPISASIFAMELYGQDIAQYASIACVISFLMTGHRSVFPSQILAIKKSSSVDVLTGNEVECVQTQFKRREKSVIGIVLRCGTIINEHCRNVLKKK